MMDGTSNKDSIPPKDSAKANNFVDWVNLAAVSLSPLILKETTPPPKASLCCLLTISVGDSNTQDNIGVTVDELGGGVDRDIGTVVQWVGDVWRGESVVNDEENIGSTSGSDDFLNLGQVSDR
ncbi:hypothetical protein WICPIJ_000161 [Wickerhamomyces pijperi]|uniref:Uncharacterized protein n=1 Tax=Wickerhamomyces pijperi TaxID=599730 RepID=A0A9P8QHI8_WICPI|nr:hypothetical protein WICPIJ_000161 [Wickerhamomyces pijperi]